MATNFSVDWLSKSFYTTPKDTENILQSRTELKNASLRPNGQSKTFLHTGMEEPTKDPTIYSPSSPYNSCGYTSGSENDVGDDSEGEPSLQRRMRTKFTSDQINKLENTFSKHKYLGATQRTKISEKLNLSETQVKTWFQNRRMKLKREIQDVRPEFFSAPLNLLPPFVLSHAPSFQHHALSGQLPAYCQSAQHPSHGIHFSQHPSHCISFPQHPSHCIPFPAQQIPHQPHITQINAMMQPCVYF